MAFDRAAAKQAGYTDEEIDAYLAQQGQQSTAQPVSPQGMGPGNEPSPAQVLGSQVVTNERPGAVAELAPAAVETAYDIAKVAVPTYLATKGYDLLKDIYKNRTTPTITPSTPNPVMTPAQQTMATLATPAEELTAQQLAQKTAQSTAQTAQNPNWMNRAMTMAREAGPTFERYAQSAGRAMAPVGRALAPVADFASRMSPYIMAAQGLTYSGNLGPKVPETGPLRGSEINPATRRGWTDEELAVYRRQYPQ